MEGTSIRLPSTPGFSSLEPVVPGSSRTSFIAKANAGNEYLLGEETKISGICKIAFLSAAGLVRGLVVTSPKSQTVVTPTMIKIGACSGPFTLNQNLQQMGILLYESPDSSILIIPVDVKSPLLVEVET